MYFHIQYDQYAGLSDILSRRVGTVYTITFVFYWHHWPPIQRYVEQVTCSYKTVCNLWFPQLMISRCFYMNAVPMFLFFCGNLVGNAVTFVYKQRFCAITTCKKYGKLIQTDYDRICVKTWRVGGWGMRVRRRISSPACLNKLRGPAWLQAMR